MKEWYIVLRIVLVHSELTSNSIVYGFGMEFGA